MKRMLPWLLAVLVATPLVATTVLYVPIGDSIRLSGMVVKGTVIDQFPGMDAKGQIVTNVVLSVDEVLKGEAAVGTAVTFQTWSGSLGGVQVDTEGEATYEVGERVLVQLEDIEGVWHTLGLAFGKWNVVLDSDGEEILRRDFADLTLAGDVSAPVNEISLREMKRLVKVVQVGR